MKTNFIALTAVITLIAFTAQAQAQKKATHKKASFGIRAGVNFQDATWENVAGSKIDMDTKTGFHAGINAEIFLAPSCYLQPGILYSTKGARHDTSSLKINISYIEVPINVVIKPRLGNGNLLLGLGPYVAFGIGGKIKSDNSDDLDIKWKSSVTLPEYMDPYLELKRFDAGASALVGYEFNKFSLQLNGQLGLLNIHSEVTGVQNDESRFKNKGFGFSAGYRF